MNSPIHIDVPSGWSLADVEHLVKKVKADPSPLLIPVEDRWRITGADDTPFEAEAVEAWGYVVDSIDRYGFVDRIEQQQGGTWRIRSIRDLLEHAGGDPL